MSGGKEDMSGEKRTSGHPVCDTHPTKSHSKVFLKVGSSGAVKESFKSGGSLLSSCLLVMLSLGI